MLTKTGKLYPYLETDNLEQKELINLYNIWYKDTAFLARFPACCETWENMKSYCLKHKELTKEFWIEMYTTFGEVGHFTFMLHTLFPNLVEFEGHCPLSFVEKVWNICFTDKNYGSTH